MAFIDGQVVTLALPAIQREFHASAGDVAWIVELYTLVLGSLMLLGGALADRYGRKRAFVYGVAFFTLGSIGCAFAWSIPSMLTARVAQALGGMLFVPASLAILGDHFSGDARGRAIGIWSAFSALTSTLGPALGGVLIDAFGWRSVFWINVPLAAFVIVVALRHISESRDDNAPRRLDWLGAALSTLAFGAITYALIQSTSAGWNVALRGAMLAGIALLAYFVIHEHRAACSAGSTRHLSIAHVCRHQSLDTLLVRIARRDVLRDAVRYDSGAWLQRAANRAGNAALRNLHDRALALRTDRSRTRIGMRAVLTIGPAIVAVGYVLLALLEPMPSYWSAFFPGILGIGLGMGITVAPLTTGVISAADPSHVGIASGINNAVSRIAGLFAIAAFTVVLATIYGASIARSLDAMHATPPMRAAVAAQAGSLGGRAFHEPRVATRVDAGVREWLPRRRPRLRPIGSARCASRRVRNRGSQAPNVAPGLSTEPSA